MKMFIALASPSLELSKYTGTDGFYSCCKPTEESIQILQNLSKELDLPDIDGKDFHCTLMYSPSVPKKVLRFNKPYHAFLGNLELMVGHDDKEYLIANLDCELMRSHHQHYRNAGCKPTFEDYKPHVTLWKFREGKPTDKQKSSITEINARINRLKESDPIRLQFGPAIISDLK